MRLIFDFFILIKKKGITLPPAIKQKQKLFFFPITLIYLAVLFSSFLFFSWFYFTLIYIGFVLTDACSQCFRQHLLVTVI